MGFTVIDSSNAQEFVEHIRVEGFSRGLKTRDYRANPSGCHAGVPTFPDSMLIPQGQQQAHLDSQIAELSSLYDLRGLYYSMLKSLDQNGYGLCWAFSSTKSNMYARIAEGEPAARLSAYFVAGKVKNWRDEGGWGSESASFLAQTGAPLEALCPKYSSSYDNAEVEANAALHKVQQWYDGTESRDKNVQIMVSAFLLGRAPVLDFNWLGHSMCGCRLVSLNPLTIDCDNSWGETSQYGEKGLYRLSGSHAVPDNVCVPMISLPSVG